MRLTEHPYCELFPRRGPSHCTCPGEGCPEGGEPSGDCSDNAVCVYYEDIFESFGEVFNVEHDMNGDYCRALCEKSTSTARASSCT